MKFLCSVEIDLNRDRVVELFDNPANMQYWQDGFVSFEHISGTPGHPGAKSRVLYKNRGKDIELIETVTVRNLPHEFTGGYDHSHMYNSMKNTFEELGSDRTRWNADIAYTIKKGFMLKVMSKIMPGAFKKQTLKWMVQFKEWAEGLSPDEHRKVAAPPQEPQSDESHADQA